MSGPSETFQPELKLNPIELASVRVGCCTPSIGAKHDLVTKLQAIAAAGFTHVELGIDDLKAYAKEALGDAYQGDTDYVAMEQAAHSVHAKCEELGLYIATLMPFGPFGGFPDAAQLRERMQEAEHWFDIIKALGGQAMLQCGTSDRKDASKDIDVYVKDLQELADMAAKHGIKIAYEQWCWSTHMPRWQDSYKIVELANRANLGVCLDTFQIAGHDFADPRTESGFVEDSKEKAEARLAGSLKELEQIDPSKIFYFQISSASKMSPPLEDNEEEPARFQWSNEHRPMPFQPERRSYLPVMGIVQAVLKSGYRGLFSVETFDTELMKNQDPQVPVDLAAKAAFILKERILKAFVH